MKNQLLLIGIVAVTAVATACGEKAATPVSPSPAVSSETSAAASDGSTLKATAPAPQQPANASKVTSSTPTLVVANSTLTFLGDVSLVGTLKYRFVVETTGGASVHSALAAAGSSLTSSPVPANVLQPETTYRWHARAELGSSVGPWSAYWTFTTPLAGGGPSYQNATELWDNLTDGRTIGTLVGGAQLVPEKGVYFPTFESHVTYTLQRTLTSGTIDFLAEGLDSDSDGGKTKVVSMQQGYSDITDNSYRYTVEKRGDDHPDVGKFRMRIITGDAINGIYDSDRLLPSSPLVTSKVYYFHVFWGGGLNGLTVREGSATGPIIVDHQYGYRGTYRPTPHVVHIGAPVPRGGPADASVPRMTIRYFYVSTGQSWPAFGLSTALGLKSPGE